MDWEVVKYVDVVVVVELVEWEYFFGDWKLFEVEEFGVG